MFLLDRADHVGEQGAQGDDPLPPSPRSLLDPRAWWPVLRAVALGTAEMLRGRQKAPARTQGNGRLGLPADFLIAPDGTVLARSYGEHVDDQSPVEQLLTLARRARTVRA
ncbi:hypothetical protein [Streptomyces virginiae]|uniref:hypothetical protein n=1 Tax=Streptomyces virginiae TaxID=1961 RepID=UPI003417A717